MKLMRRWIAPLFALALSGCGISIPPEKSAYVGVWRGPGLSLAISWEGSVIYRRVNGDLKTSIHGPLKAFDGDNFVVGIGPLATTFVVSVAPHREGVFWTMTVDGNRLIKCPEQSWIDCSSWKN
ncbi:MAG: hypothetical protein ABI411_20840 [Tahibacter sp.]